MTRIEADETGKVTKWGEEERPSRRPKPPCSEHDWIIHPDSANEHEHLLCPVCRCWIDKPEERSC